MKRILVVEDEASIRELVALNLKMTGWEVLEAPSAERALELIQKNPPCDVALLDIMLPGMDGMTICKRVREVSSLPIIMLTAKDEVEDKVAGLDIGADDYMTKPFAIEELMARIRNALRKHVPENGGVPLEERLQVKNLVMYPKRYEVEVDGETVHLTKKEYSLLEYMMRNKRTVLTRDQILEKVWGYDYSGDTNVVDVYIRYLRAKLDDRFHEKYIYTVRGVGYAVKE